MHIYIYIYVYIYIYIYTRVCVCVRNKFQQLLSGNFCVKSTTEIVK